MLEIREIRSAEHAFLYEMLYEAIYVPAGEAKLSREIVREPHLSKYVEDFGRRGDVALVLCSDDLLIGAIWARVFSNEDSSYGFVDENTPEISMAIVEDFRGRRAGTMMLEKMFQRLKTDGVKQVSLSVDKQNRVVNLYQRSGFEIVSEEGTAFTMLKKL